MLVTGELVELPSGVAMAEEGREGGCELGWSGGLEMKPDQSEVSIMM